MAFKPHNPGCGCNCEVRRYYAEDYSGESNGYFYGVSHTANSTPGFSQFAIEEGTSTTDGYLLGIGDRLQTNNDWLWCSKAWFHEIDIIDGDADITWDGGTIEFRHSDGTITVDGVTVDVLPVESRLKLTRIVLYVTETWYMVCCIRYKSYPAIDPFTEASRSSIQIFDRVTDIRQRTVTLTGVGGDTSIRAWTLADATVKTSGDYLGDYFAEYLAGDYLGWDVKSQCRRPNLPTHTEVQYQAQRAASTASSFFGFTHPATMSIPTAPTVAMYQFCFGFPPTTSTYNGPLTTGLALSYQTFPPVGENYVWGDFPGIGFTNLADGIISAFEDGRDNKNLFAVSNTIANCAGTFRVVMRVDFGSAMFWAFPTGLDPYPKPAVRHRISSVSPVVQPDVSVDVTPGSDSSAPATLVANYLRTPPGSGNYLIFTDITFEWVAS